MTLMFFLVMALITGGIGFLIGRATRPPERESLMRPPPAFTASCPIGAASLAPDVMQQVQSLIAANRKIDAIKLVRESTGFGLKEAKDYVETL